MNTRNLDMNIFKTAVEQAYDSVLITTADLDFPGPEIVYVNDAFCSKTGYTQEELIGKTPRILQGALTDRQVLVRLRHDLTLGQRFEGSTINYRKNGEPYVVRWSISPLKDDSGKIVNFVSVQRDITHEVELESFNQRLLESLGDGVFCIDTNGNFTFLNPAAVSILGYASEQELIGKNSHQLIHSVTSDGSVYAESDCPIYNVVESGASLSKWRHHFQSKMGELVPVEISARPVCFDTGAIFAGVVVFRDISAQLKLEQQLKDSAVKTRELYTVLDDQHQSLLRYVQDEKDNEAIAKKVFSHALASRSEIHAGVNTVQLSPASFSGDMVLSCRLPDGCLRVLLADFTGHGLAAAMVSLPVSDVFYTLSKRGCDQLQLLHDMNNKLCELLPDDRFMAAMLVDINVDKTSLTIWSGGMPAGILLRSGSLSTIAMNGLPMGIMKDYAFSADQAVIECDSQSRFLMFSDGFQDVRDINGHTLLQSPLYPVFLENWKDSPVDIKRLVETVIDQHCHQHPLDDDVTLVELNIYECNGVECPILT